MRAFLCVADMQFSSAEEEEVLIAEIEEVDDALALLVHVIDADTREVIGSASVELWTMVEDSTHLLRKVCSCVGTGLLWVGDVTHVWFGRLVCRRWTFSIWTCRPIWERYCWT